MDQNFRIVFMGTPGFAVASLDALVNSGANVVAVVTAPDKPAGRGLSLKEPEVKQYAVAKNIPVLQPEKLKSPEFISALQSLEPDLAVVVAFRMLPEVIWSMPKKGTINVHASLLPQYRGAAPINRAIINGEFKTGVTTFFFEKEIDTGKIIAKREVEITQDDTAGTLHDKLAAVGADLLVETVESIRNGICFPLPQDSFPTDTLKSAPKIFRDDCRINWRNPVNEVYNFVRGLSPYPGAWTMLNTGNESKILKIIACKPIASTNNYQGKIWSERSELFIGGSNGYFQILKLQPEGKKPMKADEFTRGARNLNLYSIE
jgi:methionyl-tRNA formyltransferase